MCFDPNDNFYFVGVVSQHRRTMPATVVYRGEDEKPDGSRYEMVA